MLCTGKWVKNIVCCGEVFDLAVEQPQLFRKLPKKKKTLMGKHDIDHCIVVHLINQRCLVVLKSGSIVVGTH